MEAPYVPEAAGAASVQLSWNELPASDRDAAPVAVDGSNKTAGGSALTIAARPPGTGSLCGCVACRQVLWL